MVEVCAYRSVERNVVSNFSNAKARVPQNFFDWDGDLSPQVAACRNREDMEKICGFMLAAYGNEKATYDCAVYVVEAIGFGFCKIGMSHQPLGRINALRVGHFADLRFAGMVWTRDHKAAEKIEGLALRACKEMNIHARGEWVMSTATEALEIVLKAARYAGASVCDSGMALSNITDRASALIDIKGLRTAA